MRSEACADPGGDVSGRVTLGEASARAWLTGVVSDFVAQEEVGQPADLAAAFETLGPDIVLKVASDDVVHKSDAGLIELHITGRAEAESAYRRLIGRAQQAGIDPIRVVAQQRAAPGLELFVGVQRDPVFGPLVLVGRGGVEVELWRDVASGLAPLSAAAAERLTRSLRVARILDGYRGGVAYDLGRFSTLVARVSVAAAEWAEVVELDLNPVRLRPDGSIQVLDARVVLGAGPVDAPPEDRSDQVAAVRTLLNPKSVVVVGSSTSDTKPGGRVLRYLERHGYPGAVYPVNPRKRALGPWSAYPAVESLPEVPEVAILAVRADAVLDALRQCGRLGVRVAVVFASGFAEVDADGARRQRELVDEARRWGMHLLGPNTIGSVSAVHRSPLSFSQLLETDLSRGCVAIVAQSGAIAGSLASVALHSGQGFSHMVTVGNQADIDVSDVLVAMAQDHDCRAVGLYLEGVRDGRRLVDALATLRRHGVPVVVFRAGTSDAGRTAVGTHSAVLAGGNAAYDAVFLQEGVTQVSRITQLLAVANVLAKQPRRQGGRVAILSTSGGVGGIAADVAATHSLTMASLSDLSRARLREALPSFARPDNPLDITGQGAFAPGTFRRTLSILLQDPAVDGVVVIVTSIADPDADRVAGEITEALDGTKPVTVAWLLAEPLCTSGRQRLVAAGLTVFDDPADAVEALACVPMTIEKLRRAGKTGGNP